MSSLQAESELKPAALAEPVLFPDGCFSPSRWSVQTTPCYPLANLASALWGISRSLERAGKASLSVASSLPGEPPVGSGGEVPLTACPNLE
jgi:hypothetical protein